MAIAAEFKRASPSKGDINPNLDAVEQCLEYARMGSAVISVLTEFKHFKGFFYPSVYTLDNLSIINTFSFRNIDGHEASKDRHSSGIGLKKTCNFAKRLYL